jgi:hypothetical protein
VGSLGRRAWFESSLNRALYDFLNELLAQLLEIAARWSLNYSSVSESSPLELFFFHLKGSTKAFGLQVTRGYKNLMI